MMRLPLLILAACVLVSGCTDRVLQYDASRSPLDSNVRIPILSPFPESTFHPDTFVHGGVAEHRRMPQEGTVELSNSLLARDQNEDDECDDSFANGASCTICYLVCAPLAFAGALVVLPYLVATGEMKSKPREEIASPAQQHARWLAGLMRDRQWATELDQSYISGLNEALGWREASAEERHVGFWSAPKMHTYYAYISKIVLSDASPGEYTLLLCGGSTIHQGWNTNTRTFETCQQGTIDVGSADDSPSSGEALRAALVERARLLSAIQAKELCPACSPEH